MRADPVICLVGMPGSGKSTVGEIVAARLGLRFVDLDEIVVDAAGRSIPEIFELEGEAGFRARERDALLALVESGDGGVVATGGGIVTTPDTHDALGRTTCIWLDTSRDVLIGRLAGEPSTRPLLADDLTGSIHRLADERDPLYRAVAAHVVSTDDGTPAAVAGRIVELVTVSG